METHSNQQNDIENTNRVNKLLTISNDHASFCHPKQTKIMIIR